MIELHKVSRYTLIDIEHLGLVKDGTTEVIRECMFLSMDGVYGNCFHEGMEFVLAPTTKVIPKTTTFIKPTR